MNLDINMIEKANLNDGYAVAKLAINVWENNSVENLTSEFESFIKSDDTEVFVCKLENCIVGFAQCGLRYDYVEGTQTSPVGYLEGVFVDENFRHKGYATQLVTACEKWAKDKGCSEFASDCELDNTNSLKFHIAMGYNEVNRIICFKKNI